MGRVRDAGNKSFGAVRIAAFASLIDGEIITIGDPLNGGKVFEWDNNAAVTAGRVTVTIGASDALSITALRDAINAQMGSILVAYVDPTDTKVLHIEAYDAGALGNLAFTTTMAHASNIIAAVADKLSGGSNDENRARAGDTYVVTALDVLATNIMIPTPFAAPVLGSLRVVTSADVPKYHSWKPSISGSRIRLLKNGATDLVQGDKVTWEVWSAE